MSLRATLGAAADGASLPSASPITSPKFERVSGTRQIAVLATLRPCLGRYRISRFDAAQACKMRSRCQSAAAARGPKATPSKAICRPICRSPQRNLTQWSVCLVPISTGFCSARPELTGNRILQKEHLTLAVFIPTTHAVGSQRCSVRKSATENSTTRRGLG